jgi:hypothetical protein
VRREQQIKCIEANCEAFKKMVLAKGRRFPSSWEDAEIRQWVMLRQGRLGVHDGQHPDADGETNLRTVGDGLRIVSLMVGRSRSLAVAFTNAPDSCTRHSAFHSLGIVPSEARTQFLTAARWALDLVCFAEIPVVYLRFGTGQEVVTFHRLPSFAIQAR